MYKDPDKQREAQRDWVRQKRARGSTNSVGSTVVSPEHTAQGNIRVSKPSVTEVIPKHIGPTLAHPGLKRGKDKGITETEFIEEVSKIYDVPTGLKRGKDIKTFADLPPDVQQTIDSLSMVDGKICQRVKANRTAIAINYQHLFPDRYNSTGVVV